MLNIYWTTCRKQENESVFHTMQVFDVMKADFMIFSLTLLNKYINPVFTLI